MAIAEWSVSGRVISNGNSYEMSYATFCDCQEWVDRQLPRVLGPDGVHGSHERRKVLVTLASC